MKTQENTKNPQMGDLTISTSFLSPEEAISYAQWRDGKVFTGSKDIEAVKHYENCSNYSSV